MKDYELGQVKLDDASHGELPVAAPEAMAEQGFVKVPKAALPSLTEVGAWEAEGGAPLTQAA